MDSEMPFHQHFMSNFCAIFPLPKNLKHKFSAHNIKILSLEKLSIGLNLTIILEASF